jgi:galactokinase
MRPILAGSTRGLPDVAQFIDRLQDAGVDGDADVRGLFDETRDIHLSRAPGRLDLMGGIADYSGSLVLQWPTREAALVALQTDPEPRLRIVSAAADGDRPARVVGVPLDVLRDGGIPVSYERARAWFAAGVERHWAAYIAGAWLVLAREHAMPLTTGARVLLSSRVPEGKGVSSSAAIEVATMTALTSAVGLQIEPRTLAMACQRVENLVAGAPCGVMDQMAVTLGEEGRLMALLCQPAEFQGTLALPPDLALWGVDSGVRHAVGGSDYGAVRTGAFMGYRVLAALAGFQAWPEEQPGLVRVRDERWRGYLANVSNEEFERFEADVPLSMRGDRFLEELGGTTDPVTRVKPGREYAVRTPASHAVREHARVRRFAELLAAPSSATRDAELGRLMYASHASYSQCGLGAAATDALVADVERTGSPLFGAKITGGGSGGVVAILGRRDAASVVHRIADEHARRTGHGGHVFSGSSPGATAFGVVRLGPLRPVATLDAPVPPSNDGPVQDSGRRGS